MWLAYFLCRTLYWEPSLSWCLTWKWNKSNDTSVPQNSWEQSVPSSPAEAIRGLPWTSALGLAGLRWWILPQKDSTGEGGCLCSGAVLCRALLRMAVVVPSSQLFFAFLRAFCGTVTLTGMVLPSCCAGSVQAVCMLKSSRRHGMMSNNNVFLLFKHIKSAINPCSLSAHL